jgi:hypothetical protein
MIDLRTGAREERKCNRNEAQAALHRIADRMADRTFTSTDSVFKILRTQDAKENIAPQFARKELLLLRAAGPASRVLQLTGPLYRTPAIYTQSVVCSL